MKKRLLSVMLCLCMLLAYTPAQTWAASIVPSGYTAVYTLEDIYKTADRDTPVKMLLMNDIDADNEDITKIIGGMWGTDHWVSKLTEGSVLDGGGHTIYNLNHKLVDQNFGTIRNINVSIYDTDDVEKHWEYGYWAIGHDRVAGICSSNEGTIENCNVRITMHRKLNLSTTICGIAGSNSGTIRNCIAMFYVECNTSEAFSFYGITQGGVAATSSSPSLVDHCLTLGTVKCESSAYSAPDMAGIAKMYYYGDRESYNDSACALEQMYCKMSADSGQIWPGVMFAYAGQSSIEQAQVTNCRIANDMQLKVIDHDTVVAQDGKVTSAEKITLDSRANILKNWDTSKIPSARPAGSLKPTPAPDPAPTPDPTPTPTPTPAPTESTEKVPTEPLIKTAEFSYSASNNETKQHYFYYNDLMFYSFDETYLYQPLLATASLCMAMSAYTNLENAAWENTLSSNDNRRAKNIHDLYQTLGFSDDQYFNYDKALTDTSDKVAFSMARKYINDGEGNIDTLIAVPLRGGGYGGEWGSNFNLSYRGSFDKNHVGFQRASDEVRLKLSSYLAQLKQEGKIKGNVKLWITGYSRAAATSNLLAHDVSALSSLGGVKLSRKNIYAYTFATPAGAKDVSFDEDDNIFNIISPVDIVPRVAPKAWGYGRYGRTLILPTENSSTLISTYRDLSGLEGRSGDMAISPYQRTLLDSFGDWLFNYVPSSEAFFERGLQDALVEKMGDKEGKKPQSDDPTGLKTAFTGFVDVAASIGLPVSRGVVGQLTKELSNLMRAHHAEMYLARLETAGMSFEEDSQTGNYFRSVIINTDGSSDIRNLIINADFKNASGRSVGSYADGVCKSGDVTLTMTDIGLIATFPDDSDYTFTVSGKDAAKVGAKIFLYDGEELEPARTMNFNNLPASSDKTCTVYMPEDIYDDFYAQDSNGNEYYPDSDSEYPNRPSKHNFTDVSKEAYYYDAVQWAVESEITSGTSATRFSPGNACTRAQVVTFLWRAAGCPEPTSSYNPFADVPANAYYRDAVLWAAEEGITTGVSSNRFAPNATVTRGQTVAFLWRWDGEPDAERRSGFRDVPTNAYYSDAVSWAVEMDITKGTSSTAFSPGKTCTRAQIVTFLYRDMWGGDYDD